jgi:anti-sigma factor RsiW
MSDHLSTETLIDYLRGELEPAADSRVYQHVATCPACTAELDRERQLGEALRAAAALEERALPPIVKAMIWEAVRAEAPRPFDWVRSLLRPIVAVPAAVAAALALYVAGQYSPLRLNQPVPAIAASYYVERHEALQLQNPLAERSMPAPAIEAGYETQAQSESTDLSTEAAVVPGTLDVVR